MITAQNLDRMSRDLERHLGSLCSVARNTRCGVMRTNQSRAVGDALKFFAETRAAAHAECVERLVPALNNTSTLPTATHNLLALYREAATHHIVVDTLGRRWLEQGSLESADGVTLRAELEHLQNVYARLHPEQESVLYAAIEAALAERAPQTGERI